MKRIPSLKVLQKIVDRFNADYPVGTKVILRKDRVEVDTTVCAPAEILCHTAVAWFTGVSGCQSIEGDRVMAKSARKQVETYNTSEAAKKLGISVKTIQRRCHACGIEKTGRDFRLSDRDLKKIQNAERPVGNPQMRKGNQLWKRGKKSKG